MLLSKAIHGFLIDGRAGRLSSSTVRLYEITLGQFLQWYGDQDIEQITPEDLAAWLHYLRAEYQPKRFSGETGQLSPSAVDNHWKGLRSFFSWCETRLNIDRPDQFLPRPRFKLAKPIPFTKDEIEKLLDTTRFIRVPAKENRPSYKIRLPTSKRNTAILMALLDTGMRIGEFCRLVIADVNLDVGEIHVRPFESGLKSMPRTLPLGEIGRGELWRYLSDYPELKPQDSAFEMTPNAVGSMLNKLGARAGVQNVHAHRFRHTFAIECLRSGVDPYRLQYLLGHSDMTMVQHYLRFVKADLKTAHRLGSPVDRWFRRKRHVG